MSTNWHFWRLLKMQTNSCSFVNKHHKNFLSGYFFIPYVYLNFDRKKKLEVHGMSRSLRHLQLKHFNLIAFLGDNLVRILGFQTKFSFTKANFSQKSFILDWSIPRFSRLFSSWEISRHEIPRFLVSHEEIESVLTCCRWCCWWGSSCRRGWGHQYRKHRLCRHPWSHRPRRRTWFLQTNQMVKRVFSESTHKI